MGQSNSRLNAPPQGPREPPKDAIQTNIESADPDVEPEAAADDSLHPSGSRRSSVRKSILNLVKPSSIRSRVTSIASSPGDLRRSWRNSRRWSTAPVDPTPPAADSIPASSSASLAGPSSIVKGKQPEREPPIEDEEEFHEAVEVLEEQPPTTRLPSPLPLSDIVLNQPTSPANSSWVNVQEESRDDQDSYVPITPPEPDPLPYTLHDPSSTPPPTFSEPEPQPSVQPPTPRPQAALPPRQFPPPGTLVVVQGIVHTTDVSRTNTPQAPAPAPASAPSQPASTANSRPASRLDVERERASSRTRNRLSALLRPRSTSSRPPSTLMNEAPPTPTPPDVDLPTSESSSSEELVEADVTTPLLNEPIDSSSSQSQPTNPLPTDTQQQQSHPQNGIRAPAISSSSIDVLGTLLSVAAAATAASLLTGSSEPILSSGLAPPNGPSSPSSASTTSLPSLHHDQPQPPDISANGRAERMRQAWSTIRERLGLRPSPPTPAPANNNSHNGFGTNESPPSTGVAAERNGAAGDNATNGQGLGQGQTDTRELMLAEMARAFNIGLGLNGLGGMPQPGAPSQSPAPTTSAGADSDGEALGAAPAPVDGQAAEGNNAQEAQGRGQRQGQDHSGPGLTMPPEGSFERFLVDLQIDLRAALTQVEEVQGQQQEQGPQQQHEQEHAQPDASQPQSTASTAGSANNDSVAASAASSSPSFGTAPPPARSPERDDRRHEQEAAMRRRRGDDVASVSSMPYLEDITDSDSESEFDEVEEYDDEDDFHSAGNGSLPHFGGPAQHDHHHHTNGHAHQGPSVHGLGPTAGTTNHIDAAGRINWWRLYRFPAIMSTRVDLLPGRRQGSGTNTPAPAAPTSTVVESEPVPDLITALAPSVSLEGSSDPSGTPPQSSLESNVSPPPPLSASSSASPSSSSSSSQSTPLSTSTNPSSADSNPMPTLTSGVPLAQTSMTAVVPVIVVGLQSVNSEWPSEMPTTQSADEGLDFFAQPPTSPSGVAPGPDPVDGDEMDESDPWGMGDAQAMGMAAGFADGAGRGHGRPRGWQSRAANAIRNLRPGSRRTADAATGMHAPTQIPSSLAAPGSRTFLIYVIGGYYPPDHSIVTGGPNNLESFEALLELADLLGQVKPPTVSKDEIEKSGLQTIKASQLAQYEKDGKISSNCIDRCLICLDDYESEEDIRVMTCRHAFHKNCVDEWLQRGRNNCPACRTTGVSTDAQPTSVPAS